MTVDIAATAEKYTAIALRNRALLEGEADWVAGERIDVIAADITPFAFDVAREAGIPSATITNFTWYDIYAPFASAHPPFAPLVDEIRRQYGSASLCLELTPPMVMSYFPRRQRVGLVGRGAGARAAAGRRAARARGGGRGVRAGA